MASEEELEAWAEQNTEGGSLLDRGLPLAEGALLAIGLVFFVLGAKVFPGVCFVLVGVHGVFRPSRQGLMERFVGADLTQGLQRVGAFGFAVLGVSLLAQSML